MHYYYLSMYLLIPCNVPKKDASYILKADKLEAVYIDKHYNLVVECKQGSKKSLL